MVGKFLDAKYAPVSVDELKVNTSENFKQSRGRYFVLRRFWYGIFYKWLVSFDASSNGFDWIYTTAAPTGQYSTNSPAMASAYCS